MLADHCRRYFFNGILTGFARFLLPAEFHGNEIYPVRRRDFDEGFISVDNF